MDEFSPTDAALEGVRIPRERPVAVLWWWGAYIVAALVQFALPFLPLFHRLAELSNQIRALNVARLDHPGDMALANQLSGLMLQAAPAFLLFSAIILLIQMVLSTAVLRAVLRPAESAFGYLRLSMDEVRQMGLALLILVAFLVYTFAVLIVSATVLSLLAGLLGIHAQPDAMVLVAVAMVLIAYIYPAVRLSLAPAMTLADGRISFLRSWSLTKGRFWPLLGAYMVAWLVGFALIGAGLALWRLAAFMITHRVDLPDPQTFQELLNPVALGAILFNALFGALLGAILTAPLASAFRQITGRVGAAPPNRTLASGSPWAQP